MAPSTLPQLMDANPATASPNMTGIFLFDTHEIFRTHLFGLTSHPTPFTLISVFKFCSATLHTSPLDMPHPIWTQTALSPDKRSRIRLIFFQEIAKRDLADSADTQPFRQIPPGEIVMLLALNNPAASMSIHEHP
jgi:hypothetical protein